MTITQTTIDSVTWTPLVAPRGCVGVTLQDAALATAIKLRSTPTLATSEITIGIGKQGRVITTPMQKAAGNYNPGETIVYMQAAAGTITVVATFI